MTGLFFSIYLTAANTTKRASPIIKMIPEPGMGTSLKINPIRKIDIDVKSRTKLFMIHYFMADWM